MVEYITHLHSLGCTPNKFHINNKIKQIIENFEIKTPFKNNIPGRHFWDSFWKRHPELSMREGETLDKSRANAGNKEVLEKFFVDLKSIYDSHPSLSPAQIYNCDETGRDAKIKAHKLIAPQGARNVYTRGGAVAKHATIMGAGNAAGNPIPPLFIFSGKRVGTNWLENAPPNSTVCVTDNGWMDEKIFIKWFDFFLQHAVPLRPLILFVDGHYSHFTLDVINKAREAQVIIICFPSHLTHILQPLDVAIFGPLKKAYKLAYHEYFNNHPMEPLNNPLFTKLIASPWLKSFSAENLINGFAKTGLWPINNSKYISLTAPSTINQPKQPSQAINSILSPPSTNVQQTEKSHKISSLKILTSDEMKKIMEDEKAKKETQQKEKEDKKKHKEAKKRMREEEKELKKQERERKKKEGPPNKKPKKSVTMTIEDFELWKAFKLQ